MSVSPYKTLRIIASIFVDVVRGIPLMIVAAFIFWGIPNLIESITGHQSPINDFVAGTIALTLNGGAYIAEIVRGGIEAVPSRMQRKTVAVHPSSAGLSVDSLSKYASQSDNLSNL